MIDSIVSIIVSYENGNFEVPNMYAIIPIAQISIFSLYPTPENISGAL